MTASSVVRTSTAIADPNNPGRTLMLNSDGSLNVKVNTMLVAQQAGTAYTFAITDSNNLIQFTNAGAITATIPPNSSVAFPIGTVISVEQDAAGVVTATAGAGVTLHSTGAKVATNGQYAQVYYTKVATNTWLLSGNLA